jgi:hypothetical protein
MFGHPTDNVQVLWQTYLHELSRPSVVVSSNTYGLSCCKTFGSKEFPICSIHGCSSFRGRPRIPPGYRSLRADGSGLTVLRQHKMELPKSPAEYCTDWVRSE